MPSMSDFRNGLKIELDGVPFVMVEFQIIDHDTAICNEEGDSAHSLYKDRQLDQVKRRLRKGGRRS